MRHRLLVGWLLLLLLSVTVCAEASLSPRLVGRIKDSVVYVDVTLTLPDGSEGGATGSGFVISADGQIVTNAHVVAMEAEVEGGGTKHATQRVVTVTFHSGTDQAKTYPAQVLRENHKVDLALLKIDLATPTFFQLGDSDAIEETSSIFVCGHPLGLKEISIRSGSVTAHRTWEGRPYLEHDAMAESGNSGGPVVDQDGFVVGIHTLTLATANNMTKFAIPSNVLRDWLASPAESDPTPVKPGANVKSLLEAAKLKFKAADNNIFDVPYDDNLTVHVHQYQDFLRAYVKFGEIPGADLNAQGVTALKALTFNYDDPVGRLSLWQHDEDDGTHRDLYWECQIPMSVATSDYVRTLVDCADVQAGNWQKLMKGEAAANPDFGYPGGDEDQLLAKLKGLITAAKLKMTVDDKRFLIDYDNNVTVRAKIWKGMIYTYSYVSGMMGSTPESRGRRALEFLKRNWNDDFGRLALTDKDDLVWESQVPASFMTPDYFAILAGSCSSSVADFWKAFGKRPLNG